MLLNILQCTGAPDEKELSNPEGRSLLRISSRRGVRVSSSHRWWKPGRQGWAGPQGSGRPGRQAPRFTTG